MSIVQSIRLFNQPLELGLRGLYILAELYPEEIDIQKILFLDYILVHSADVEGGPDSLHAPVPYRTGEWLVHRQNLEEGLLMFASKELIVKSFSENGITYTASELSKPFITHLKSPYSESLLIRAKWLIGKFGQVSTEDISEFMLSKISVWGTELR
jgi:hypothetical protein